MSAEGRNYTADGRREKLHGGWKNLVKFIGKQNPRVDWNPWKSFSRFLVNIGIGTASKAPKYLSSSR